jgi:hypothetical protein
MDLFSTNVLTGAINSLIAPSQFLLNRYFGTVQTETSEEIHFDILDKTRRLAPFVSPVVAGKIVESQGHKTKTFQPAYIKDKRVFDSNRPLKRAAGEQIAGVLSPAQRMGMLINRDLTDQREMIDRRLEVMAAEALRTGAVTVTGELYPTQNVDFGRNSALTVTLAGAARWGQTGVNPLDDLQDWSNSCLQISGAMTSDVTMTVDVWKLFRKDPEVKAQLDRFRGNSTMITDAQMAEGGVFMGVVDGFNIFVYAGWYLDDAGVEQPILPAGTVLLAGSQLMGVQAFGAIRDEGAGFQAIPYYSKSWIDEDPSVRYLMSQSAPLVVPTRVNASMAVTVF